MTDSLNRPGRPYAIEHVHSGCLLEKYPEGYLVDVELDEQGGNALPVLGVVLPDAVHRLGHVLQHQMQVHLVLLCGGVEAVTQPHHIRVAHHAHDLQLPVLEPLVLQHLLDGDLQRAHGAESAQHAA